MKTIVKLKVGSHLHGTTTPESDVDYKGIFLPTLNDMVLGNRLSNYKESVKSDTNNTNTKNTSEDIDCEMYSLQYFLFLAFKGDTTAIEMLFAPNDTVEETSPEWEYLRSHRKEFITKELKAFLGYCRTQASKYSTKGTRLKAIKESMGKLIENHPNYMPTGVKLKDIWDKLYTGEHVRKYIESKNNANMYEVCGRKFDDISSIDYVYTDIIEYIRYLF